MLEREGNWMLNGKMDGYVSTALYTLNAADASPDTAERPDNVPPLITNLTTPNPAPSTFPLSSHPLPLSALAQKPHQVAHLSTHPRTL